eukprot:TRINITY_DN38113_c0_g1_i1.p1 TRINITY_DN38113_c0_g1~~TRINITY_DN38113_c0_g1_i1.p1  ORF type:complete len:372 (-),score=15.73 TRINITY_DN38113_c0_g1_i1:1481-2596(-)
MTFMNNDDLLELFGKKYLDTYLTMKKSCEARVKQLQEAGNTDVKISASKFKRMLIDLPSVIKSFMANGTLVNKMWEKYQVKVQRYNEKFAKNKEVIKEKRKAAKLINKPKRKFIGALLTKITPEQYREALQQFNDAEKGKGLHKYANLTPGKMVKELERQAYATEKNDAVAKLLQDPDCYKAEEASAGFRRHIKDIEARLADKTEEQKLQDPEYIKFVKPYKDYRTDESILVSDIRAMIAKGMKPAEIKSKIVYINVIQIFYSTFYRFIFLQQFSLSFFFLRFCRQLFDFCLYNYTRLTYLTYNIPFIFILQNTWIDGRRRKIKQCKMVFARGSKSPWYIISGPLLYKFVQKEILPSHIKKIPTYNFLRRV